jgi:hypothetical protein
MMNIHVVALRTVTWCRDAISNLIPRPVSNASDGVRFPDASPVEVLSTYQETFQFQLLLLSPVNDTHYEDGNCNACRNFGTRSTNDMALT